MTHVVRFRHWAIDLEKERYGIAVWERPRHHKVNAIRFHWSLSSELLDDRNIIVAVTRVQRRNEDTARQSAPRRSGGRQYSTTREARCISFFHHANLLVPTWTTNQDKTLSYVRACSQGEVNALT
jgi:hypothetical protein